MSSAAISDVEAVPYDKETQNSSTSLEGSEKEVELRVKHASQYPVLNVDHLDLVKRQLKQRHIQMWVNLSKISCPRSLRYRIAVCIRTVACSVILLIDLFRLLEL